MACGVVEFHLKHLNFIQSAIAHKPGWPLLPYQPYLTSECYEVWDRRLEYTLMDSWIVHFTIIFIHLVKNKEHPTGWQSTRIIILSYFNITATLSPPHHRLLTIMYPHPISSISVHFFSYLFHLSFMTFWPCLSGPILLWTFSTFSLRKSLRS